VTPTLLRLRAKTILRRVVVILRLALLETGIYQEETNTYTRMGSQYKILQCNNMMHDM
jgi:hypothetical protein